jgi:hypothetical protein
MKSHEIYVLVAVFLIVVMAVSFDNVIVGIVLFLHSKLLLNNIVIDPNADLTEYDGAVILNCLHGGGCPEGIVRTDDVTGEIQPSEIVPKKAEPVVGAGEPTKEDLYWANYNPEPKTPLEKSIDLSIFLYFAIIGALIGSIIFVLKKKGLLRKGKLI